MICALSGCSLLSSEAAKRIRWVAWATTLSRNWLALLVSTLGWRCLTWALCMLECLYTCHKGFIRCSRYAMDCIISPSCKLASFVGGTSPFVSMALSIATYVHFECKIWYNRYALKEV